MKVSEMPYKRVEKDVIMAEIKKLTEAFKNAKSVAEVKTIMAEYDNAMEDFSTMYSLAYVRFTLNTKDEFYLAEQDYWNEVMPEIGLANTKFMENFVTSALSPELRKVYPPVMFKNIELSMKASDERLIPYQVEDNKTVMEYVKLLGGLTYEFRGETVTPSKMAKYATNPDRATRKEAVTATCNCYTEHKKEFDDLYSKLVEIRTKEGRELGYENFCEIGYANMGRNCYGKEDIAKFRGFVKKYIVPLCSELKEKIRKEQGWDAVHIYDDAIFSKDEPKPIGTPEEIFANGKKMYAEMMPVASKLFNNMCEIEAFDVLAREGKSPGGYCTSFDKYKTPFIFANFNGSLGDIDVLTHEFGHALAADRAYDIEVSAVRNPSMETAEVHSMSMEFLAYPWIDMFFGDKTEAYKFNHICGALTFIPYGTIVDYFQQTVYDNPDMTAEERNQFYAKIEKEFLPHLHTEDLPFYGEGRRWQRQSHIYEVPFYYIDYCLAQFTAFQILALSLKDYKNAQKTYMAFLEQGGSKPFTELLKSVGLKSPFEEDSFVEVVTAVKNILKI